MVQSQKAKIYKIDMDEKGKVTEKIVKDTSCIENSAYKISEIINYDNKENEYKTYIENQIRKLEIELNNIEKNITQNEPEKYITDIKSIKSRNQGIYEYAHKRFELNEIRDKNIITDTEKKYSELNSRVEKLFKTIKNLFP